jgi:hypothetical protein
LVVDAIELPEVILDDMRKRVGVGKEVQYKLTGDLTFNDAEATVTTLGVRHAYKMKSGEMYAILAKEKFEIDKAVIENATDGFTIKIPKTELRSNEKKGGLIIRITGIVQQSLSDAKKRINKVLASFSKSKNASYLIDELRYEI